MKLQRAAIERLVPHAGAMCLLDEVAEWTDTTISCSAAAPTDGHPLLRAGAVSALACTRRAKAS